MIRKNRRIEYVVLSVEAHTRVINSWVNRFLAGHSVYFELPKGFNEADVKKYWIRHVLDLALEYCHNPSDHLKMVYTSERQRFFTDFQNWEIKKQYYEEVIQEDINDIIAEMDAEREQIIRERLIELHESIHLSKDQSFKMVLVGDCIFDEILVILRELGAQNSIDFNLNQTWLGAYSSNQFNEDMISSAVTSVENNIDAMAISFFTYWGLPQFRGLMLGLAQGNLSDQDREDFIESIFSYIRNFLGQIRSQSNVPIFLHNLSGLPWLLGGGYVNNDSWNAGVEKPPLSWEFVIGDINGLIDGVAEEFENIIVIDERHIISQHGKEHCIASLIPEKLWRNSLFHPRYFGLYLAEQYMQLVRAMLTLKKTKAILVDFDNTLWSGVMAEGGVVHHKERQILLKKLSQQGILLVALSKNDPENIRWSEMYLSGRDFIRLDVGWDNKVDIIADIAKDLNVGMDTFVFVDDCTRQLGLVEHYYPQVRCLNSEDERSWAMLQLLFKMKNTSTTEEAKKRTQRYKQQSLRKQTLLEKNSDRGYSLLPLNIQVSMNEITEEELDRSVELLERTNQFNCTGKTYTKSELLNIMNSSSSFAFCFILRDKFGEMGMVGLVIVSLDDSMNIFFDAFVMSCRAMGYGLEDYMVASVMQKFTEANFIGHIKKTSKNGPSQNLYERLNFSPLECGSKWFFSSSLATPIKPHWINQ